MGLWLDRIRRGLNRSPSELWHRAMQETRTLLDRYRISPTCNLSDNHFIRLFKVKAIDELWLYLSDRPYPSFVGRITLEEIDTIIPGEALRVVALADQALALKIDILGSGLTTLNDPILWNTDFKVQKNWPVVFFRDIDILNPDRESDVKVPWEMSRLQWLIPVGQAYMLTKDEKYAEFAQNILISWISNNPYARGVNWAVAMEASMRIFTWTWLFHVFKNSEAWANSNFRVSFLRTLYEHAVFVERYFEDYGVNSNHCTADAAALVFAGLFFGTSKQPMYWQQFGWKMLLHEMPRQILEDGVNFEGSVSYHRFVAEMFFWPAKYRRIIGEKVPVKYVQQLILMTEFIESYTKPDGLVPLWGDADDGRVFPFGGQHVNDHSYLPNLVRSEWPSEHGYFLGEKGKAEVLWVFGPQSFSKRKLITQVSKYFKNSGFLIMRNEQDHVFIDCGPVGLDGRGGHGHNDCLSFEASLNSVPLITDSGTFVYTASYEQRDKFRGTASHNTPMVDGHEQNRFISDAELFCLKYDAKPEVRLWQSESKTDTFIGSHSGYQRLNQPVIPVRKIVLEKAEHRFIVRDEFQGDGEHSVMVPLHFAPGCEVFKVSKNTWSIKSQGKMFYLLSGGSVNWLSSLRTAWISPSYGVKLQSSVIKFTWNGSLEVLTIGIYPEEQAPEDPQLWLKNYF